MKFASYLLILFGFSSLVFAAMLLLQRENPYRLAFATYKQEVQEKRVDPSSINTATPIRISIPELTIDVPLFRAEITNYDWPTTSKGASYIASAPSPGEPGNSIVYAHNWKSLFGPLPGAKINQKVIVHYSDSSEKVFSIKYLSIVSSKDVTILSQSTDTRITLYTCYGFLDSKRFVAVAIAEK